MSLKRIAAAFVLSLAAAAVQAATVAERSPFYQGHWWDSSRSGNGFEIFNAGSAIQVLWYTFDEAGRPTWYTANGTVESLATAQAWPLQKHRWVNGRKADATTVGSLKVSVRNSEMLDVSWDIGGKAGSWTVKPLILSGMSRGTDRSGSYFDPANSGWGLTVTEQGDVLGGVVFTYDSAGEPTWVAGFERGATSGAEMFAASGNCPYCASRATTNASVGRLTFGFQSEIRLTLGAKISLPMAAGVNADGARLEMFSRPASWRAADGQLANFDTDAALRTYLTAGMLNVAFPSIVLPSPAPSVVTSSTTNLQEQGVDEADLVKSNGTFIYGYAHSGTGARLPLVRVARVGSGGTSLAVGNSVSLSSGASTPMAKAGLYLDGTVLASIASTQPDAYYFSPWGISGAWMQGKTFVELFSLANPDVPATAWRAEIEGHLVSSRRIGKRLYLVTRSTPYLTGFNYGATTGPLYVANQQILASTPLSALLPRVRVNDGAATALLEPKSVYVPPQGGRKPTAEMTLVTAIDLERPGIVETLGIAGAAEAIYASPANLYLASSRYELRGADGTLLTEPSLYLTDIHQVRLDPDAMRVVGTGMAEGYLDSNPDKAPFRMSEQAGRLRVVTSSNLMWGGSKNKLAILEPSTQLPGVLGTVSWLPNAARPESLGKPGEQLYSTRFVGDRLYAVTFKKIDPLYIVDLANVADPRIAGQLELPGFSDYLHPLPGNLLLGFGKDTVPSSTSGDGQFAWYQGLRLSLFDVSNAAAPREVQSVVLGKRGSDSALLREHHAFSVLAQADGTTAIAFPAKLNEGVTPVYGSGDSAMYPWARSGLMRYELRGTTGADARLTALPPLVTHTASGGPSYTDGASDAARSVLFPQGAVYYSNGFFWRQDNLGNSTGPFF